MKRSHLKNPGGALLLALALASCSQGPTAPSASGAKAATVAAPGDGNVTSSLAGDTKTGPVDMDMNLVRVAQTDGVQAFYAYPGGEYNVLPGRQVEIYVQIWTSNPTVPTPPRVIVDWGVGEKDNIHCGPCRLSRTYSTPGKYKVTVTLDDRVSSFTTRTFTLDVRYPETGGTFAFSNNTLITINDNAAASPYPSSINVSGVAGRISDATVTIYGYTHTWHSDVSVLLVAPGGQTVSLMGIVNSSGDGINATITFQDGAPPFPHANVGPGSFTFSPTNENPYTAYAPAPGPPYGTALSALNGADPNGTWKLFVGDHSGADIGQLGGGWSMTLTTVTSSSAGVVKAGSSGTVSASFATWPIDHILNYPYQKPKPRE